MADNYLEQRMDDLRSGRLRNSMGGKGGAGSRSCPNGAGGGAAAHRSGVLSVAFPSRRVIVTGGANGIGLAISRAYLKAGCKVAVFDIDKEAGERMAREEGVRFYHLDLADAGAIEKAFSNLLQAWRDVDIIVNNAGVAQFSPLTEETTEHFDRVVAINMRPPFILARLWALHRRKYPLPIGSGGRMINISSTRHLQSEAATEAYSASKGGIASLTHSLMMSLSEFGITVNCISPGWIHTGPDGELTPEDHLQHPSRRVGKPDDIARLCIFLSLPGNDFINGADIAVDGGMTRKMIYV